MELLRAVGRSTAAAIGRRVLRARYHAFKARQIDTGLADFDKAIELDPKHAGAYADCGYNSWNYNRGKHGKEDLDKAVELDPKLAKGFYYRAIYHQIADKDYAQAGSPTSVGPSSSIRISQMPTTAAA